MLTSSSSSSSSPSSSSCCDYRLPHSPSDAADVSVNPAERLVTASLSWKEKLTKTNRALSLDFYFSSSEALTKNFNILQVKLREVEAVLLSV